MSASTENVDEKEIIASVRAGANLTRSKPLFSHDSKFLFCCAESLVKVYSTISGECVHDLEGHKDKTTGLVINSQNKLQLLSCSLDQTVIFWDYCDGVQLKKIRLNGPLHGIWIRPGDQHVVQVLKQSGNSYCLEHCDMLTSGKDKSKSIQDLSGLSSDPRCSAIGCKGKFLAAVKGSLLYVKSTSSKKSKVRKFPYPDLTCVACHPVDYCIATGTSSGKIILWWSFLSDQSHVVKTTLHWHALPVLDLAFTLEGSYLLSGGHECVLVKWQYNSEHRDFRPRLGAPLTHVAISPDNILYATSHEDNAIHLMTSSFTVTQVYQGLTKTRPTSKQTSRYPAGVTFDPRSNALVLNGKPGHLQFFSVHRDKQLYNLDIVCQNYISSENIQRPLDVTEVISAEFSSTGSWLATMEYWNNGVMTPEMRLKFWEYNKETQSYTLNTAVESPHDKTIKCLRFRPDAINNNKDPMVVTTSEDGKFKIWSNLDDTNIYRKNTRWTCESVGYFHDKPAGMCAFTSDGSLLGVVFGTSITLWDPENNILRETLNSQHGTVRFIEFGKKSCSPYMVTTTASNVTVWDLITCTVVWSAIIECTHLAADPLSDVMAVFGKDQSLYVFKPSDSNYLFHKRISTNTEGAVFIPHQKKSSMDQGGQLSWQCESQLYWITSEQDLVTLSSKEAVHSQTQQIPTKTSPPQTPFSALLTAERKRGFTPSAYTELESHVHTTAAQFTAQLLETASHVQAPVTSLCSTFIHSLLIREKSHSSSVQSVKDEDDSDLSDMEEKVTTSDSESEMEVDDKEVSVSKTDISSIGNKDKQKTDIVTEQFEMPNLQWYTAGLKT